jgi:hypothetical protein
MQAKAYVRSARRIALYLERPTVVVLLDGAENGLNARRERVL